MGKVAKSKAEREGREIDESKGRKRGRRRERRRERRRKRGNRSMSCCKGIG